MDDVDGKKAKGLHSSTVSSFIVIILILAINVLDYYHHNGQSQDNKHDSWHPMDNEHIKGMFFESFVILRVLFIGLVLIPGLDVTLHQGKVFSAVAAC
jgi:hypothetical protein